MKAELILLILVLVTYCQAQQETTVKRSVYATDTEELQDLTRTPGSITLYKDYTVDMYEWIVTSPYFTKLNGNGYTIMLDYRNVRSGKQLSLFSGMSDKEVYDLKFKTTETSFISGSLFGSITNCYLYHVELTLSYATLRDWSVSDGLISSVVTNSAMLNVGVTLTSLFTGITMDYTYSHDSISIGIIAGSVKGTCTFAGLYVSGKIEVTSGGNYNSFGILFGSIESKANVLISTSTVNINYFKAVSAHSNYRVGSIIGKNEGGNVELKKLLVNIYGNTHQEASTRSSLYFGTVIGSSSGKVIISNSFIYNTFNVIEIYTGATFKSGGVIGTAEYSTLSITNSSVIIKFSLNAIPTSCYGGFLVGYTDRANVKLNYNMFAIMFVTFNYPFKYYDIGNDDYSTSLSATNTYYYYSRYGTHTIYIRHYSIQQLNGPLSNPSLLLPDFNYDTENNLNYYSKMAHLSSNGYSNIIDDSNKDFSKVDITFSGTTPSYKSDYSYIYNIDNIPSTISSKSSDDFYIIFMPKSYESFTVDYDGSHECVSSSYLPLSISPAIRYKAIFTFSCERKMSFELVIKSSSHNKYYSKTVYWKSGGDDSGGDDGDYEDEYDDPRESLERLITQILIYGNAGVAVLIVLISICCYFTNRNK